MHTILTVLLGEVQHNETSVQLGQHFADLQCVFTLTVGSLFIIYQHGNVKISTVHAELLLIQGDMLRNYADSDAFRQSSDHYATCCFTDPEIPGQ